MAIDFPNSPTTNDSFTAGGKKSIFNGTSWTLITANAYTIPTGEVTTAMILDGTILNVDINASAAIDQGKISGLTADLAAKAPLASPTFTGTPTLPTGTIATTQTAGNNTTAIATTAFVGTAVANLVDSAPATLNTLDELAAALGDDANFATTTATAIGLKAPLASPTFTGTPTSPTASTGTNTTQIATTAFVTEAIPVGVITPYAGSSAPSGWLLCFGQTVSRTTYATLFAVLSTTYNTGSEAGTDFRVPDLRGRAVAGLDNMGGSAASRLTATVLTAANALGATGGTETHTLTTAQLASHNHTQDSHNHTQDSHNHTQNAHNHSITAPAFGGVVSNVVGGYGAYVNRDAVGGSDATNWIANSITATNIATTATNQAATAVNQSTGSGTAHLNTQPTIVLNYIIKAL